MLVSWARVRREDESMEKGCINFIIEPFHFSLHTQQTIRGGSWVLNLQHFLIHLDKCTKFQLIFNLFQASFLYWDKKRKSHTSYLLWLSMKNFWCTRHKKQAMMRTWKHFYCSQSRQYNIDMYITYAAISGKRRKKSNNERSNNNNNMPWQVII